MLLKLIIQLSFIPDLIMSYHDSLVSLSIQEMKLCSSTRFYICIKNQIDRSINLHMKYTLLNYCTSTPRSLIIVLASLLCMLNNRVKKNYFPDKIYLKLTLDGAHTAESGKASPGVHISLFNKQSGVK